MSNTTDKKFPLWDQFIDKKKEWIGGIIEDFGDTMDRSLGLDPRKTKIEDIRIMPNGKISSFFEVKGKLFSCGFDVRHGGLVAGEDGWITFSGYMGHKWRIKKNT